MLTLQTSKIHHYVLFVFVAHLLPSCTIWSTTRSRRKPSPITGTVQRGLRTSDPNQSENEHLIRHQNKRNNQNKQNYPNNKIKSHSMPRDTWMVAAEYLDDESIVGFQWTDRAFHSIAKELKFREISITFHELFENTMLTPSDIMTRFRFHNGSSSNISQFLDHPNLVMVRGSNTTSMQKDTYLAIRVRELDDNGWGIDPHEKIKYLVFTFRGGRFHEMRSESEYNENNEYSVKCNLIALQNLFHGKRIKLSTGIPSTTAIRSDLFDAEWHFKAFVKPYYRCWISGGIIWFILTVLLLVAWLVVPPRLYL